MEKVPRILVVNEQSPEVVPMFKILNNRGIKCQPRYFIYGRDVVSEDISGYDMAIIDASDDCRLGGNLDLSEWLREQRPDMPIIGSSVQWGALLASPQAKKYDSVIGPGLTLNNIKYVLRAYELIGK